MDEDAIDWDSDEVERRVAPKTNKPREAMRAKLRQLASSPLPLAELNAAIAADRELAEELRLACEELEAPPDWAKPKPPGWYKG